jgi:hypothetical protein
MCPFCYRYDKLIVLAIALVFDLAIQNWNTLDEQIRLLLLSFSPSVNQREDGWASRQDGGANYRHGKLD